MPPFLCNGCIWVWLSPVGLLLCRLGWHAHLWSHVRRCPFTLSRPMDPPEKEKEKDDDDDQGMCRLRAGPRAQSQNSRFESLYDCIYDL